MARPRNDELKAEIQEQAWRLFHARGYDAATYAAIAEACGISRNLVQYHFPKKELLAIGLMDRVLEEAEAALRVEAADGGNEFSAMCATGTCYFEFFLQDAGWCAFLLDIISSRSLTESVLAFNASWAFERVGEPEGGELDEVMRTVIISMGGFYELLYYCLKNDKPIEVGREIRAVMRAFICALGRSEQKADALLDAGAVDGERIARAVARMDAALDF